MRLRPTVLGFLTGLLVLAGAQVALVGTATADSIRLCLGYSACSSVGMSNAGYSSANRSMYWRMYSGHNCTNYVAYRMVKSGMPNVRPWSGSGNATNWGVVMSSITDQTPSVGAVAWWSAYHYPAGSAGHVAYVEKVLSPTTIIVSQDSWGGDFSWARITKSGRGWPSGFIHFNDRDITNTAKPTVTGVAKVGSTLTATRGTWSQSGLTFRYQWRADGAALTGATARTFTLGADQLGKRISVKVTVSKPSFPTKSATTAATALVVPGTIANSVKPTVTGTPRVGVPLTATSGTWSPKPDSVDLQWLADGVPIKGATSSSFTPGPGQLGKELSLATTAARDGYTTVTSTVSADTVEPGILTSTTAPTVTGTPQVGATLTATPGAWTPTPSSTSYQWLAGGVPVTGATSSTFTPSARHRGKPLAVEVTVARKGYSTVTSSVPTAPVLPGTLTRTRPARVSGVPQVGVELSVHPGAWSPTPSSYAYQWLVDGVPVAGQTSSTFLPRAVDVGKPVSVQVTAARSGYTPSTSTLDAGETQPGTLTVSTAPTLHGTVALGQRLSVSVGSASPRATATVQWARGGVAVEGATGTTYTITSKDLGHHVNARVTWSRAGYHALHTKASPTSVVKSVPVLRATQDPGRGRFSVTVHVRAPGVHPVEGYVSIRSGGKQVKLVRLRDGAATTSVPLQAGLRHVRYAYLGSAPVFRGSLDRTVRIR